MKRLFQLIFAAAFLLFLVQCESGGDFASSNESNSGQSGSITRFAVHNDYMYALNSNEIMTYSLANPSKPVLVNSITTDYGLETIIIYDNVIYLGSRTALYILGIDNPAAPTIISESRRADEFFNGCDPVVVKGNYAYSTIKIIQNICGQFGSQSALLVYDVSDLSSPNVVGTYPLDRPNGLGIKGDNLFICDEGSNEVVVFDITDPTNVTPLSPFNIDINDPFDIIVDGCKMLVSTQSDFRIYDVTDIASIYQIGSIAK